MKITYSFTIINQIVLFLTVYLIHNSVSVLQITRNVGVDVYRGHTCTNTSYTSAQGECTCNYGLDTYYGYQQQIQFQCYSDAQMLKYVGCSKFYKLSSSNQKLNSMCSLKSLDSIQIWNSTRSLDGTWNEIKSNILQQARLFHVEKQQLKVMLQEKLEGLMFKLSITCEENKTECILLTVNGTSKYPLESNMFGVMTSSTTSPLTSTANNNQTQLPSNQTAARSREWLLIGAALFGVTFVVGIGVIICVYKSNIGRRWRSNKVRSKSIPRTKNSNESQITNSTDVYKELEDEYQNYEAYYKSLNHPNNIPDAQRRAYTNPSRRPDRTFAQRTYSIPGDIKPRANSNIEDIHNRTYSNAVDTKPRPQSCTDQFNSRTTYSNVAVRAPLTKLNFADEREYHEIEPEYNDIRGTMAYDNTKTEASRTYNNVVVRAPLADLDIDDEKEYHEIEPKYNDIRGTTEHNNTKTDTDYNNGEVVYETIES